MHALSDRGARDAANVLTDVADRARLDSTRMRGPRLVTYLVLQALINLLMILQFVIGGNYVIGIL